MSDTVFLIVLGCIVFGTVISPGVKKLFAVRLAMKLAEQKHRHKLELARELNGAVQILSVDRELEDDFMKRLRVARTEQKKKRIAIGDEHEADDEAEAAPVAKRLGR